MPRNCNDSNSTALVLGLEEHLSRALESALSNNNMLVRSSPFLSANDSLDMIDRVGADLVFCSVESRRCFSLLTSLRRHSVGVPVIAVSRLPMVSEWLDALEAGALDYCAAPFEPRQISWILQSALQYRGAPVAGL